MFSYEEAESLLNAADVFYENNGKHELNMNDAMEWGTADCEVVPKEEMQRVAGLFFRYGWHGVVYWVVERRGWKDTDFRDVNRAVEFIRHEEKLRKEVPDSSTRAYAHLRYTIGTAKEPKGVMERIRRLLGR